MQTETYSADILLWPESQKDVLIFQIKTFIINNLLVLKPSMNLYEVQDQYVVNKVSTSDQCVAGCLFLCCSLVASFYSNKIYS